MDQSQSRSIQRSRTGNTVASFLLKTFEILEHPDHDHIIAWTSDNVSFNIKNVQKFSREILPRYFRHSNFTSFVRQLNMYDFHKIKQEGDSIVFRNELFTRNGQALLKEIKRKAPKIKKQYPPETSIASPTKKYNVPSSPSKNPEMDYQIKKEIEAQVIFSSNVFEKTIKYLERTIHFRIPYEELLKSLSQAANPQSGVKKQAIIEMLYDMRTRWFNLANSYETAIKQIDGGYQQKMKAFGRPQQITQSTDQIIEESKQLPKEDSLERETAKTEQQLKPSQGFQPCSTVSLVGKYSTVEDTNVPE